MWCDTSFKVTWGRVYNMWNRCAFIDANDENNNEKKLNK